MCRLRSIDGSATFTIVLSSMIMKRPNGDRGERPPLLVLLGEDASSHPCSRLVATKLVDARLAEAD